MKHNKQRLSVLMILALLLSVLAPVPASAATVPLTCTPLVGKNINAQDYMTRSAPVTSYLTTVDDGYMRLQGDVEGKPYAVYYDSDFNLVSRKKISGTLSVFGGFYESASNYFLVSGQPNPNEDDAVEVYRVTKYDKNWKKIKSCGLYGANTYYPFEAGSCRIAMDGQYMIIRTCHKIYIMDDGLRHQTNVTIEVDTKTMTVTDSCTEVTYNEVGYVSHSFNQFVEIEDHKIVSVDHGDAFPRSICLMQFPTDVTTGIFMPTYYDPVTIIDAFTLKGATGQNKTGASIGGFAISSSHYLIAGTSVKQDKNWSDNKTRNIFIAAVNKTSPATPKPIWITDLPEDGSYGLSTPQLVPIGSDRFLLLWAGKSSSSAADGKVYYCLLNADGTRRSKSIYCIDGYLSDCVPLITDNKAIWYTWEQGKEVFYRIPLDKPSQAKKVTRNYDHNYKYVSCTTDGHVSVHCSKCDGTAIGLAPTEYYVGWQKVGCEDPSIHSSRVPTDLQTKDSVHYVYSMWEFPDGEGIRFTDVTFKASDPDHCLIDRDAHTITFTKSGTFTITTYPTFNPALKLTFTFVIHPPLSQATLMTSEDSPQVFGTALKLTAKAKGGIGPLKYKFIQFDKDGNKTVLQNSSKKTYDWKAPSAQTYQLMVKITDTAISKSVSSDKLTFTIKKAPQPMTAKGKTVNVSYAKLKEKKKTILITDAATIKKAKGTVTYTKTEGSTKITVNKTTGKITVAQGTKKGTYKIRIKATAAGTKNYKAGSRSFTVTIVVG